MSKSILFKHKGSVDIDTIINKAATVLRKAGMSLAVLTIDIEEKHEATFLSVEGPAAAMTLFTGVVKSQGGWKKAVRLSRNVQTRRVWPRGASSRAASSSSSNIDHKWVSENVGREHRRKVFVTPAAMPLEGAVTEAARMYNVPVEVSAQAFTDARVTYRLLSELKVDDAKILKETRKVFLNTMKKGRADENMFRLSSGTARQTRKNRANSNLLRSSNRVTSSQNLHMSSTDTD